jgi:hypothetical protein
MGGDLAPVQTLAFVTTSRRVFIGVTISILTSKLSGRECQGHDNSNCNIGGTDKQCYRQCATVN